MTRSRGIRFLAHGGRRIAYGTSGDGPVLVAPAWWVSHLEHDWRHTGFRSFWEEAAEGFQLLRYDRPGVGLSDRDAPPAAATLDAEVELLAAMLDTLECERATLLGGSSGGCTAVAFAASHPHRVERLLLYGTYADGSSIAPAAVTDAVLLAVRSHWGLGSRLLADVFLGEEASDEREAFAAAQRAACDAETAAALLEAIYRTDVSAQLGQVRAPTVVVHRRADRAIPYEQGLRVAAGIEDATLVPLDGSAHLPWFGDSRRVARALRTGLAPDRESGSPSKPPAGVLSAREREVLALVASGMTEREISEQLIVSPHTVHRHMANIRSKLGSSSGAAAVAEAGRRGLI